MTRRTMEGWPFRIALKTGVGGATGALCGAVRMVTYAPRAHQGGMITGMAATMAAAGTLFGGCSEVMRLITEEESPRNSGVAGCATGMLMSSVVNGVRFAPASGVVFGLTALFGHVLALRMPDAEWGAMWKSLIPLRKLSDEEVKRLEASKEAER